MKRTMRSTSAARAVRYLCYDYGQMSWKELRAMLRDRHMQLKGSKKWQMATQLLVSDEISCSQAFFDLMSTLRELLHFTEVPCPSSSDGEPDEADDREEESDSQLSACSYAC